MRSRTALLGALIIMRCCAATGASGATAPALLDVVINGQDTGQICLFENRGGQLWASASDLKQLGFILPPSLATSKSQVELSDLKGVQVKIDEQKQIITFTAPNSLLRPTILDAQDGLEQTALSPAGWGLVLNYDSLFTFAQGRVRDGAADTGGVLFDLRGLSPHGVFDSTLQYQLNPAHDQKTWERLDDTYTYSNEQDLERFQAGDVISGALSWSRAVRLAGVRLGTDFALRPDLVTYPVPQFSGAAAVPSTVNLLIGGSRVFTQTIPPGPFQLLTLPRIDGAGDAVVDITNALGQQETVTVPFYITPSLLRPGLVDYSVEAGAVRTNYATAYDNYEGLGWSGSIRAGLTDWLTVESHAEGTASLGVFGAGAVLRVAQLGVISLSAAGSTGGASAFQHSIPASGESGTIGLQRQTPRYNIAISASHASAGYHDIAAVYGTAMPHDTLTASFGVNLGRFGSLNLAYVGQTTWPAASKRYDDPRVAVFQNNFLSQAAHVSQVNLSYGLPLTGHASFYATGYKDLLDPRQFALTLGVTVYFGGVSGYANDELQDGIATPQFGAQKSAIAPGDWGFDVNDTQGQQLYRSADLDYLSRWAEFTAGAAQSPGESAGRAGAQGALVLIKGGAFAANRIADSFAVVSSGDVPDVRVTYENRPAGRTNSSGLLLVPELQSYNSNELALDPDDLPPDAEARTIRLVLRPQNQSFVFANFGVHHDNPAVLLLVSPGGKPVPLGSILTLAGGGGGPIIVGYGGQAYATGLAERNDGTVTLTNGKTCAVSFDFHPQSGNIQTIGPVPCK